MKYPSKFCKILVIKMDNDTFNKLSMEDSIKAETEGKVYKIENNICSRKVWMDFIKRMNWKVEDLLNYTILFPRKIGCTHGIDSKGMVELLNKENVLK